jgi:hypothetical protein
VLSPLPGMVLGGSAIDIGLSEVRVDRGVGRGPDRIGRV